MALFRSVSWRAKVDVSAGAFQVQSRNSLPGAGSAGFSQAGKQFLPALRIDSYQYYWQSPHPERGLRKINSSSAPNPVTRLWTACTRLKIQMLQSAIFH